MILFKSNGGIYRRYSDDMVVVCPIYAKEELNELVNMKLKIINLKFKPSKTKVFQFKREKKD